MPTKKKDTTQKLATTNELSEVLTEIERKKKEADVLNVESSGSKSIRGQSSGGICRHAAAEGKSMKVCSRLWILMNLGWMMKMALNWM